MAGELPDSAKLVFGEHVERAAEFVRLLEEYGVERGLIGPREVEKIWDRHVLNSAVIEELFQPNERVVDVGSGAGLPGVPLAIARPDLRITLLEPMARRIAWLEEVKERLQLDNVTVLRGRAEEGPIRKQLLNSDAATARAVAPLEKLTKWCLPLLRGGGRMVALKGERAQEELERDGEAVLKAGGANAHVVVVGADVLEVPTTVLIVERQMRRVR
ncbi:16S rRNA (guanine(527)-N(7))-methyltransferase RsmG [Lentzea flaviverrucosa]|uniref:Ribosomal RNA small subunit methyltransferase G n=1 Tax=Lentzea flaviverrucosa TaxID=200379 RepID=A0A1H9XUA0_9PSEU|nr:16S rRNA (guanine(527)-N(7))-methyltransferase RsmG [Lentzea flaviverrucosa]RDI18845.1 16S rRNA m(7)G-527 methyltransferase [Lentzea flaviverrucosa]SES49752.1 16S rRNA (guanine527-N7)-methyltransferase [Lentzea flaviverrucosa]